MYRLKQWEEEVPATWVGTPGGNSFASRTTRTLDGVHSLRKIVKEIDPEEIPSPTVITVNSVHDYVTKRSGPSRHWFLHDDDHVIEELNASGTCLRRF